MVTVSVALQMLPVVIDILKKLYLALSTGKPQSIDEEFKRLEAARLRPSEDVIADADNFSKRLEDSR